MLLAGKEGSVLRKIALGKAIPTNDDFMPIIERVNALDRTPATIPTIYEVGPVKYGLSEVEIAAARYSLHAERRAAAAASRHEPTLGSARYERLKRQYLKNEVDALVKAHAKQGDTFWHTDVGGDASDKVADARYRTLFTKRRSGR